MPSLVHLVDMEEVSALWISCIMLHNTSKAFDGRNDCISKVIYFDVKPPSTTIVAPVTNEDSSDAKNNAV